MKNLALIIILISCFSILSADRAIGYDTYGPVRINTIKSPTYSLPPGNYSGPQTISLSSSAGSNARIRYTVNGLEPSRNSGWLYNSPITITGTATIKAITYLEGIPGSESVVATNTYFISSVNAVLLSFNIAYSNSDTSTVYDGPQVHRIELVDIFDYVMMSKTVQNNVALFWHEELRDRLEQVVFLNKIRLYDSSDALIGHMSLKYSKYDLRDAKRIDATLIVHGYPDSFDGDWDYYVSGERMVSMLVKPNQINVSKSPLLLVHGLAGKYPYFKDQFMQRLNQGNTSGLSFDIWQFYYPYDQHIEKSAFLLGDAISRMRLIYNQRINLLAHSMGGLVSRYLIQSDSYQTASNNGYWQGINKLLMLGTPNHGSHASFRADYYWFEAFVAEYTRGMDTHTPAARQLVPGSEFLTELNDVNAPKSLFDGAILQNTYLVVAGSSNPLQWVVGELHIPGWNDDLVVSLPSASMLNFGIPLCEVRHDHGSIKGDTVLPLNPAFLTEFFSSEYIPVGSNIENQVRTMWHAPLYNNDNNDLASLITLSFNHDIGANEIPVRISQVPHKRIEVVFGSDRIPSHNGNLYNNRLQKSHWVAGNSSRTNYFIEESNVIGASRLMGAIPAGNYQLRLLNAFGNPFFSGSIPVLKPVTSMVSLDITPGQQAMTTLNNINSSSYMTKLRFQNRDIREETYEVEQSSESMIFYIGGQESIPGFDEHNAYLIDPANEEINALNYTSYTTNGAVVEFHEDIATGYVFYYVSNPLPGTWKLRYNDSIPEGLSTNLVDSPFSITVSMPDSNYVVFDQVEVLLPLPQGLDYTDPSYTVGLMYTDNDLIIHDLGNLLISENVAEQRFETAFIPENPGIYTLDVAFQCLTSEAIIRRTTQRTVSVSGTRPPQLQSPLAGAVNQPTSLSIAWNEVAIADAYLLQVYKGEVEEPVISIETSNLSYDVLELDNAQQYYWQVSSVNEYGTSSPSEFRGFKTMPGIPSGLNPQDNTSDLPQTVFLSWQSVNGASSYKIQLAENEEFDPILMEVDHSVPSYELNGLANLQTYYWRVAAADEGGIGDWSAAYCFTIREAGISFPSGLVSQENETLVLPMQSYIDNYNPANHIVEVSGNQNIVVTVLSDRIELTPPEQWFGSENLSIVVRDAERSNISDHIPSRKTRDLLYQSEMLVQILEVDDPPILSLGNDLVLWDVEPKVIDLSAYITDPDTPLSDIQVSVSGGANIGAQLSGTELSFSPPPGWYGFSPITIEFSYVAGRANHLHTSSRRMGLNNTRAMRSEMVSSYEVLVQIASSKPVIPVTADNQSTTSSFTAVWNSVPGATGYELDVSVNENFTSYLDNYHALALGNISSHVITNIASDQEYFYRVRATKATRDGIVGTNSEPKLAMTIATSPGAGNIVLSGSGQQNINIGALEISDMETVAPLLVISPSSFVSEADNLLSVAVANTPDQITLPNLGLVYTLRSNNASFIAGSYTLGYPGLLYSPNSLAYRINGSGWNLLSEAVFNPIQDEVSFILSGGKFDLSKAENTLDIALNDGSGATLPVVLSSFTASINPSNKVSLRWTTQSESGLYGFRHFRSINDDMSQSQLLDSFTPATNTSQTQSYIVIDSDLGECGVYYYWIEAMDLNGQSSFYGPVILDYIFPGEGVPDVVITPGINSAYPNPFNPSITIRIGNDRKSRAKVTIYNIRGQLVKTLLEEELDRGNYSLMWNGTDDSNRNVGSGVYFVKMSLNNNTYTRKIISLK